jgi:hypothetical protein
MAQVYYQSIASVCQILENGGTPPAYAKQFGAALTTAHSQLVTGVYSAARAGIDGAVALDNELAGQIDWVTSFVAETLDEGLYTTQNYRVIEFTANYGDQPNKRLEMTGGNLQMNESQVSAYFGDGVQCVYMRGLLQRNGLDFHPMDIHIIVPDYAYDNYTVDSQELENKAGYTFHHGTTDYLRPVTNFIKVVDDQVDFAFEIMITDINNSSSALYGCYLLASLCGQGFVDASFTEAIFQLPSGSGFKNLPLSRHSYDPKLIAKRAARTIQDTTEEEEKIAHDEAIPSYMEAMVADVREQTTQSNTSNSEAWWGVFIDAASAALDLVMHLMV